MEIGAYLVCLKCNLHSHLSGNGLILVWLEPKRVEHEAGWSERRWEEAPTEKSTGGTERRGISKLHRKNCTRRYLLVPLVDGMIMNERRLDLDRSQEPQIVDCTVVDIERDGGLFGCNIAIVCANSETWRRTAEKINSQRHFVLPDRIVCR